MNGTGQVSASSLVVDPDPRSSIESEIDRQSIAIGARMSGRSAAILTSRACIIRFQFRRLDQLSIRRGEIREKDKER